jgi:hypothetical protein
MKILTILSFFLFALIIGCKQKQKQQDIFEGIPIADTGKFIDSIEYKTRLDAGSNFTARPSLKKNEYYYDERNFRDSLGNLKEYSIIERWDTGDIFTNYFYYKNHLINVSKTISTAHINQMSIYYFRNDSFFGRYIDGRLALMQKDTLLSKGYQYLSIKGDVGDTSFRKYFGKKSYPPNSMISIIK